MALQHTEGWNVAPLTGVDQQYAEGWNVELLVMATLSLSANKAELIVGESVTYSGTAIDSAGNPQAVEFVHTAPDGQTTTTTVKPAGDGTFDNVEVLAESGEWMAQLQNDLAGRRTTERWES